MIVYVVTYRMRDWSEGVEVYATREQAEASVIDSARNRCEYEGNNLEEALEVLSADHIFEIYEEEVR